VLSDLKTKNKILKMTILLSLLSFLIFESCSLERDLARKYISTKPDSAVLIMMPDFVYKTNLKIGELESSELMNEYVKDSLLFERSKYLKHISDTTILRRYYNSLVNELKAYGLDVYSEENINEFLQLEDPCYMFNIAQIELEEYIVPVEEQEVFDDTALYFQSFKLNAVSINSWFEVTRMNVENDKRKVLYASHYVFDFLKGSFRKHVITGDVKYKYYQKEIVLEDIYSLADELGEKYAGYIFDYILNEKIKEELPENVSTAKYYHYNRSSNTLSVARDGRFTIIEE
jgi:hypothetical protein